MSQKECQLRFLCESSQTMKAARCIARPIATVASSEMPYMSGRNYRAGFCCRCGIEKKSCDKVWRFISTARLEDNSESFHLEINLMKLKKNINTRTKFNIFIHGCPMMLSCILPQTHLPVPIVRCHIVRKVWKNCLPWPHLTNEKVSIVVLVAARNGGK